MFEHVGEVKEPHGFFVFFQTVGNKVNCIPVLFDVADIVLVPQWDLAQSCQVNQTKDRITACHHARHVIVYRRILLCAQFDTNRATKLTVVFFLHHLLWSDVRHGERQTM